MTKAKPDGSSNEAVVIELNREGSVLLPESARLIGSPTPRIFTPLNDLPSRGQEVIDFVKSSISISCLGKSFTSNTL
jgi:hypothetical protein